jgi:hypothetical protein
MSLWKGPGFAMMNRGYLKKYSMVLEYIPQKQHYIPPTMYIIHSKDTISKPPFSTSFTKYKKCKLLDSSIVHQRVHLRATPHRPSIGVLLDFYGRPWLQGPYREVLVEQFYSKQCLPKYL